MNKKDLNERRNILLHRIRSNNMNVFTAALLRPAKSLLNSWNNEGQSLYIVMMILLAH